MKRVFDRVGPFGVRTGGVVCAALLASGPVVLEAEAAMLTTDISVTFEGLRSSKGMIRGCLTRNPHYLVRCDEDPASFKVSVQAKHGARMDFKGVPSGEYALAVLHDENGNARADRMLGIPKEGVGFSRNPGLMFGPPRFDSARFHVSGAEMSENVKIKYFL